MGQRQFRSDDTDRWRHGIGQKSNVVTITTDTVLPCYYDTITGAEGDQPALPLFDDGDIVVLHNSRGSLANTGPTWELNRKYAGALQYEMTRAYPNGGNNFSQVVKAVVCRKFILSGGATLTIPAWNTISGQGGLGVIMADIVDLSGGYVDLRNSGFMPGPVGGDYAGGIAENWTGPAKGPYEAPGGRDFSFRAAVGNAGGSGTGTNTDLELQPGAGGPGNATAGTNGSQGTSTESPYGYGIAGGPAGNDDLSTLVFSGAGSVGAGHVDGGGWYPGAAAGRGTASLIIICRKFIAPLGINLNGSDAAPNAHLRSGGSSASAGGNLLIQGQDIDVGSGVIEAHGGTSGTRAGNASYGRVAIRYSKSFAGGAIPVQTVDVDPLYRQLTKNQGLPFLD
jgi:hypothetical protein